MTQTPAAGAAGPAGSGTTAYNAQRIALVLVDHGSRFQAANDLLADVAKLVRDLSGLERIYHAHMELAEPSIRQAFEAAVRDGATTVVYHPYFLSPGRHSMSDIPRMVAEAAQEFPGVAYCVTEPLGLHPKIGEVVLERAGLRPAPRGAGAGESSQ
jgi:sirohydrochlorin ferrochelatase